MQMIADYLRAFCLVAALFQLPQEIEVIEERRIDDLQVYEGGLVVDSFLVGEGVETGSLTLYKDM